MIYGPFSKYLDSSEAVVAPGAVIDAEGLVLVRANGAQAAGVLPSTGGTAETFAGFSIAGTSAAPFAEGFTNKQETFRVPASGKVTLQFAPVPTQFFAFDNDTNVAVSPAPTLAGKELSGLPVGDSVTITYKYPLTVVQARALHGDVQPGGYSGAYVNQIGLLKRGMVYTDQFDASKNWAAATSVKAAAGGQVTDQSGSGITLPAVIIAVPGSDVTYLGLEFSAV
jgi:hypothetical protein